MEKFIVFTSTEMVHVATDKIVYVCNDGNCFGLLLMTGKSHRDSADAFRDNVFIDSSISQVVLIMCFVTIKMFLGIT